MKRNRLIMACTVVLLSVFSASIQAGNKKDDKIATPSLIVARTISPKPDALLYALPNTGLRFVITSEKVEKVRGDFYLYSERFLGLKDIILEDEVEWRIKDVRLETYGVPNTKEVFQLLLKPEETLPLIQLSQDGVILAINTMAETPESTPKPEATVLESVSQAPYTEAMLLANSTAKMAEEAARYIYRLRESKTAMLTSESPVLPPDGEAYAMSIAELNKMEEQFVSLFKGYEKVTEVTSHVNVVPEDLLTKDIIFRFSNFAGVVAKDDFSGSPVLMSLESNNFESMQTLASDSAGLFAKRPAPINITLQSDGKEILSEEVFMSQFGELRALPYGILKEDIKIEFHPKTGAIKSIMK